MIYGPMLSSQVLATFDEHGADYLRPVYDALDEAISYDELRVIRLYYLAEWGGGEKEPGTFAQARPTTRSSAS